MGRPFPGHKLNGLRGYVLLQPHVLPSVGSSMKPTVEIDGWLSPSVALVLLESLRDVDTPPEILEDEAFRVSLPRRLGLSDVIDGQMRRYADMRKRRRQLEASEFLDLLRLIARRPDARMVFEAAGDRLGSEYASRTPRAAGLARRLDGEGKQAARCMRNHLDTSANALKNTAQINAELQTAKA